MPAEFDCGDCGDHVVHIIADAVPKVALCALCIYHPGWFEDPQLVAILDSDRPQRLERRANADVFIASADYDPKNEACAAILENIIVGHMMFIPPGTVKVTDAGREFLAKHELGK